MRKGSRIVCLLLTGIFLTSQFGSLEAQAANKTLTLNSAKSMAVANSEAYEKLESSLDVKQVSLKQAVRTIKEKQRSMSTFRWTPLLSFKFPTKPDLSEAFEFQFKPIQIQTEIDSIKHKMTDQVLAEYESVSNLYVDIVVAEESVSFNESRLVAMQTALAKNRARLKLGEAKQADVDSMEKSVTTLTDKIATEKRNLEAAKKKLGKKIGMNVSTSYQFPNPFREASIDRSRLQNLIQYTLERDQTYYDASMAAETSLIALRTNNSLMSAQYGQKMNYISSYVTQALDGQKINSRAFKKSYEEFLNIIDQPWQGKKKILFIKIPREWFKGEIDGIRYVEDEPYALYEAALEYQDALLEKNNTREELEQQVEDTFNTYISVRNAYLSSVKSVEEGKKKLASSEVLNRLGELTYEEYKGEMDEYEEMQNSMFESLATYTQTLYSFDRLTCGGITSLLSGTGVDMNTANPGESYIDEENAKGAYYFIEPIVQEEAFRLTVSIPDDFEVPITHYELWCDNVQVGDRTEIDSSIKHLSLAREQVTDAKIRFYNEGEFVDDCEIDADVYSGPLEIVKDYQIKTMPQNEIGTYQVETNDITGMVTIALELAADSEVKAYLLRYSNGKALSTDTPISIDKKFQYLGLMQTDMSDLIIEYYDENSKLLFKGYFDTTNMKLMKDQEEE